MFDYIFLGFGYGLKVNIWRGDLSSMEKAHVSLLMKAVKFTLTNRPQSEKKQCL